ncbi:MAG: STAS domain-containing protein [Planctomycetaceae bacterium]|nr:STAS domain-containing protein [Planctomycetaceae bacterium]
MTTSNQPAKIIQQEGVTVIALGPEYENLDEAILDDLRKVILDAVASADPPLVVLDLSHTKFFGSAFIEILFRAWNRIEQQKGEFCLCGLTPYCAEVIDVTHLNRLWSIFDDREAAVSALKKRAN